jgi:predicted MFS family arabinose efflux permease
MSRLSSPVSTVFLTVFIDLLGFGIVIPLLPLYAEKYNPGPLAFGLLMASYSAMQLVFAPVLGRLSDRVGRRPVLLVSLLGTAAGYLLFAFAQSLPALFAARIIDGITGGNIGTAQAVIADVTPSSERARGMAVIGMAFGLGFIFGPAIGGFAVSFGPAAPGLVAASLSFAAFLWALVRLPETRPVGAAVRPFEVLSASSVMKWARNPALGALLLMALLSATAFAGFEATFSQFLAGRFGYGPSTVAWVFVVVGVTSAVVQGVLIRRLVPRFGEGRLVFVGLLFLLCGFALFTRLSTEGVLAVAIVLVAAGSGLLNPSLMGWVSRKTDPTEQGEVLGAFQSMAALGRIAGPFWGENVYLRFGPVGPNGTGVVLESIAAAIAAVKLGRKAERKIPEPAETAGHPPG